MQIIDGWRSTQLYCDNTMLRTRDAISKANVRYKIQTYIYSILDPILDQAHDFGTDLVARIIY